MAAHDLIREAQDPSTSAARLAELVQADRATWPSVAAHPAAYDGLLQWLSERDDAATNVVLSARATNLSAAVPPPVPPVAPAAPVTDSPVESAPAEPAPVESPTVEAPAAQAEPDAVTETIEPAQPEPTVVAPFEPLEQPGQPTTQTTPTAQSTQSTPAWAPAAAPAYSSTETSGAGTTGGTGGSDNSKRNVWVLAALIAAVLVLIGGVAFGATQVFGGDDDKEESSSSQSRSDDSAPSGDESDAPAAPDDESDDSTSSGGDNPEFCTAMTDLQEISTDALAESGTPDLDDLKEMATEMRAGYAKVQDAAPADLKDEIGVMVDYLDLMENPSAAASEDFSEKIKDYSEASMKVSQYYAKSCF